ncbi:hypothetical protein [Paludisphaera borealis]|nr:hypothetical protein [Paludisphaera borealis]
MPVILRARGDLTGTSCPRAGKLSDLFHSIYTTDADGPDSSSG